MPVTDFLIGEQGLQDQRDEAIDFAQERYDPSALNPQVTQARQQATEGISQGQEAQARQRTVESLFRPTDTSIYGGSQARAIAGQQQRNRQAQSGMAQFESQLTQQDLQTRQQGQQQFAQARTQQNQLAAQRDAAIQEAEMQYESEVQKRRQQLGSTVANLAGTVAGSFLGPAGAAAGGAIAGGLAGGGMGAVQGAGAGFSTAYQRQQSEQAMDQLTGSEEQQTPQQPTQTTAAQQPQDQTIQPDMSGMQQVMNLGDPMSLPAQGQTTPQAQPQTQPTAQPSGGDNQFNMIEHAQTQNFIDELMNFEGEMPEQQTQQQAPLGDRLYDRPQQAVETLLGRGFGLPMDLSRGVLNTVDMFGQEYGQATQQFQQEQGVNY